MTPSEEHRTRIESAAPIWQHRCGLDHFEIEHVFVDGYAHGDESEGSSTVAEALTDWQYERATIKWYTPMIVTLDFDELEKRLVHELTHVLLAPEQDELASKHDKLAELSTERVSRALYRAYA